MISPRFETREKDVRDSRVFRENRGRRGVAFFFLISELGYNLQIMELGEENSLKQPRIRIYIKLLISNFGRTRVGYN